MLSDDTQNPQGSSEAEGRALAVSCRGVSRDFGMGLTQTRVLHGIDLDIAFGGQTFLVGPSGCGKTTLVSLIAGLLTPTTGRICVLGEDLQRLSPASLVEFRARNIGFIFQQFNLIPALNAVENAAVPLVVQGRSLSAAVKLAAIVLDRLGMGNYLTYFPWQLSGGQQQRVAIARSLVHNPRIVICDEPTAALDAKSGLAVMALLTELAASPERAVIVVTHDTRIFSYADRTISLMDGRIATSPSSDGQAHS